MYPIYDLSGLPPCQLSDELYHVLALVDKGLTANLNGETISKHVSRKYIKLIIGNHVMKHSIGQRTPLLRLPARHHLS